MTNLAYQDLKCPECGSPMELAFSDRFRYKDGSRRPYYRCFKYPECKGTHGAHPNGAPLGFPADARTKKLRISVHELLDRKIGDRRIKRNRRRQMYFLQGLGTSGHVSQMNAAECEKVIAFFKSDAVK